MASSPIRYSLLDLVPILAGRTAADSFDRMIDLARHAESWGYHRFWLAEHHNIPGIASAATAVLIGHVAQQTRSIRVGAGGIMLPNHPPLIIAEQFGTLESLYPGRIDLGLGRAPGGDAHTIRALRRHVENATRFPADVQELQTYFKPAAPGQKVHAIPGQGLDVPIYLLGSSQFSAQLAAQLGLPFAFASHFAPDYLHVALDLYRSQFQPSAALDRPYVIVGVNVFAADTDSQARRLFTSLQQTFLNLVRGVPGQLPPPVDSMDVLWNPAEQAHIERMTRYSVVGGPDTVRQGFEDLIDETGADELMTTAQIHDHADRLHCFDLVAQAFQGLSAS